MAGASRTSAEIDHAKADLIVGERRSDGMVPALLSIQMAPGFKTYWYMPGDGGVPPHVMIHDGQAHLHLPAPSRIQDAYGVAVGYDGTLNIPLELDVAPDASRVTLDMLVGVCADICIPFIARLISDIPKSGTMLPRAKFQLEDAFRALPSPLQGNALEELSLRNLAIKGQLQLVFQIKHAALAKLNIDGDADEMDVFAAIKDDGNFYSKAADLRLNDDGWIVTIPVISPLSAQDFRGKQVTLLFKSGQYAAQGTVLLP